MTIIRRRVTRMGVKHNRCCDVHDSAIERVYAFRVIVRMQQPVDLGRCSTTEGSGL